MESKPDPGGILRDHQFSSNPKPNSNPYLDTSMNDNNAEENGGAAEDLVSEMSAMTTTDSPPRRRNNHQQQHESPSVVSGMSGDDNRSVASKQSVWSQAAAILLGRLPEETIPELDSEDLLGREIVGGISTEGIKNNQHDDANHDPLPVETKTTADLQGISPTIWEVLDSSERLAKQRSSAMVTSQVDSSFIDFLQDDPRTMTYSRRLALFLLRRYPWYNPHLKPPPNDNKDENTHEPAVPKQRSNVVLIDSYPFTHSKRERPSLEKAWAYWDHVALSRFLVEKVEVPKIKKFVLTRIMRKLFCKANKQLKRAEPGEREHPTALYEPMFTPHKQLGDFGLGVGLYFSTLRAITVLTFLAGLLNIPNFKYYNSKEYQPNVSNFQSFLNDTIDNTFLLGAAICTDVSWVVCPDCVNATESYFNDPRHAYGIHQDTGINESVFFLRNNCSPSNIQTSMINFATLVFIIVGTVFLDVYLRRMEVAFDEDEQTAQDYSIVIENPPGDATDPAEWRDFFLNGWDAHVTACTVAVDNDLLVRSLVERREKLRTIEMLIEPGTSMDTLTLAGIAAHNERQRRFWGTVKAFLVPGVPELFARITVLNAKVQGLAQQDYPATNVFVTFETEKAQRAVLSTLNFGSLDVKHNNTKLVQNPRHLFRGEKVLKVTEPEEPNTIRWQDLNEKMKERLKQQLLTTIATFGAIFAIAFLIRYLNGKSVAFSAFGISISNSLFPMFAKFLTSMESHKSEGSKQKSLYGKIAFFRWANTAIVITIITPFTATLTNGKLINQVYTLFFAEIITTNAIQLLDPMGHVSRHILAPRAATQDAMNLKMQGQVFELAERYTNMTKILFLALWYCAVFPGALFMCSVALFINYFVDRFSLMRTWKRPPQLGTMISEFSRRYFFSLAIVAMAILCSFYWAGFPFDNLCLVENETVNSNYTGDWLVTPFSQDDDTTPKSIPISIPVGTPVYQKCLQDFFRFPKGEFPFPFVSSTQLEGEEWMTPDQEDITDIYGWAAVGVIILVALRFANGWYSGFMSLFRGSYDARGDDQDIPFSSVPSINSYVPEVQSPIFSYPLLACNIDRIDSDLLEWTDPDRPHAFYDLTKDAEVLLRGQVAPSKVVFSQIAHYPPQ